MMHSTAAHGSAPEGASEAPSCSGSTALAHVMGSAILGGGWWTPDHSSWHIELTSNPAIATGIEARSVDRIRPPCSAEAGLPGVLRRHCRCRDSWPSRDRGIEHIAKHVVVRACHLGRDRWNV